MTHDLGTAKPQRVIHQLSARRPDESVTVEHANGERDNYAVLDMLEAARILDQVKQAGNPEDFSVESFQLSYGRMTAMIATWAAQHADRVQNVYISPTSFTSKGGLAFLLVAEQRNEAHDDLLEDSLIDLDLAVHRDDQITNMSLATLALPPCDMEAKQAFLSSHAHAVWFKVEQEPQ